MTSCLLHLSVVLPLLVGAPAPAPDKVEIPKGLPPELQMVHSQDRDKGTLTAAVVRSVTVAKTGISIVTEFVGGKTVAKQVQYTYYEQVPVMTMMAYKLNEAGISATDGSGKKLSKDNLWKLLTPGKVIAVTVSGTDLDPAYRAALARDIVILSVPQPKPGAGEQIAPPRVEPLPQPKPGDRVPQ